MTERVELIFKGMSELVAGDGLALITLTDLEQKNAISFICDSQIKEEINLRILNKPICKRLLPEVLAEMLADVADINMYEVNIYGLSSGIYDATLINKETLKMCDIRLSDGVLLSLINNTPIYIDRKLMNKQSTPYKGDTDQMTVPINTLATDKLKEELQKAIDNEDYHLASQIKEELNSRINA